MAEQLLDSLARVTGVKQRFPGWAPETRAMTIPHGSPSYLLTVFGRIPDREFLQDRNQDPNLSQVLHLINGDTLALMKPNSVLINTARGPIVEEKALIEALQVKRLAGAALDVFEHEPLPPESPLLKMDNVLLAPHNSNSSPAAWERVHWNTIRNLLDGLDIPSIDLME